MHETAVTRWFGAGYARLHPLLQALHREGGRLRGTVDLQIGPGLRGWLGRRIARRMGLPAMGGRLPFEVEIRHVGDALYWDRRFGDGTSMRSVFCPVGAWPDGYWIEATGPVRLHLGVDVVDGGWSWRCRRAFYRNIPVPMWLFPRTTAGKRAEDGRYRFEVAIALPLLGHVLRYGGLLDAQSPGSDSPNR